jgi:oligoribonuclease NrnB/cAMP/cGMP phosphodiesterase (DHH superfamily)
METRKPLVIYHKDCSDGIGAAWCFWRQYGDKYEYHPGVYNESVPDIMDRDVYLVDFSYKRDVVDMICQYANNVVLLDHHASALDDLWDLSSKYSNFDMTNATDTKSGAMIAWDYVKAKEQHKKALPLLIQHIQDRDMWKFKLPHTREIMTAVFSYPMTFDSYDKMMKLNKVGIKKLISEGNIIKRKYDQDLENILKTAQRLAEVGGYLVPLVNCNYIYASDIGNILAKDQPFSATYYDTAKSRCFSLRSVPGGLDVSDIAKAYNGGGHKHAAGFKVERGHPLACI